MVAFSGMKVGGNSLASAPLLKEVVTIHNIGKLSIKQIIIRQMVAGTEFPLVFLFFRVNDSLPAHTFYIEDNHHGQNKHHQD